MHIPIRTTAREDLVDVAHLVIDAVAESGAREGAVLVYCPHTTAGVTINEHADPDVAADILAWLARTCPRDARWRHGSNADAHVKSSIVGSSVLVPITDGRLALGTWQGIFFCEFDGPRNRYLDVRVLSE